MKNGPDLLFLMSELERNIQEYRKEPLTKKVNEFKSLLENSIKIVGNPWENKSKQKTQPIDN